MTQKLRILLVEDNPADADLIQETLPEGGSISFEFTWASRLADAIAHLKKEGIDLVVLDLGLPDSQGLATLHTLRQAAPDVPVIVLTGTDDDELAANALREGAQDYLVKGQVGTGLLIRAARYALERQKAAKALQESERELREAQRMAQLGHWCWDVKSGKVEWSEEVFNLFRLDPRTFTPHIDAIMALSPWPEDQNRDKELIQRATDSHEKGSYDQRFLRPDGSIGYYHSTFQGSYDVGGDLISIVGTVLDITERKRAEEALRAERTLLRTLVDHLPVAAYVKDAAGRKTLVNPLDLRNLGVASEADALGKTDFDLFPHEQAERFWADDQQVLQTGCPILNREESLTRSDGTTAWLLTSKVPLRDAAGRVTGLVGVGLEITEVRLVMEQLRKLARAVEQSPVSIIITNRKGDIEFVNPKFTQVTGYTTEEVLGKNPRILKSGETSADEYLRLWETITAGKEWRGEFHNKRKDGTLFWEAASISAIRDASGEITHFVAVKEDVTEQKLTQATLLRTQRVESIGSLASGIAHDLNNILTPILICAPMFRMERLTEEDRLKVASTIEASARRAVGIVKQLLSFGRGNQEQKSLLQVKHLLREMTKIAQETFPRTIHIEPEIPSELWPVTGNATQLHQVLLNLCINARDAMPRGGQLFLQAQNIVLDEQFVAMHAEAHVGPYVHLRVRDTGTGIPDAIRDRIFEPFFSTKDAGKGTGLGLTTVLGIVKDHGGFLRLHTTPGDGTTFDIYLPARPEHQDDSEPHPVKKPLPPRGQGELVLVVDDEPSIISALEHTLTQHGYQVIHAHDGVEGLAQFTSHCTAVRAVVTDFMMPLMDGANLCRVLRRLSPSTPIIVSTGALGGQTAQEFAETMSDLGVRHLLQKPHTGETLLNALYAALHPEEPLANSAPPTGSPETAEQQSPVPPHLEPPTAS